MKKYLLLIMVLLMVLCGCSSSKPADQQTQPSQPGSEIENEKFRTIQVYHVEGKNIVDRPEVGELDAYESMMLIDEDLVNTYKEAYLQIKLDEDKYILLEPYTKIHLYATGTGDNSKTRISLKEGAIVTRIDEKLKDSESFEIETPNSTMAVRGTVFRVAIEYDENQVSHTSLQTYEGAVEVKLVYPDGSISEESYVSEAGEQVRVWGDEETSDFEAIKEAVVFDELLLKTLMFIGQAIEDGHEIDIDEEVMALITNDTADVTYCTVDYLYQGSVFASEMVLYGSKANVPLLMPASSGSWDFDFDTEILEITEINWK